jgi:hypothetical protein
MKIRRRRKSDAHELRTRLLGPTAPQLTCEECFAQIDRYVELEAAGADAAGMFPQMRVHLEGCPACDEEHDDLLAFVVARR